MGPAWPSAGLAEQWHAFSRAGGAPWTPESQVLFKQLKCLCCTAENAHDILHFCWLPCKTRLLSRWKAVSTSTFYLNYIPVLFQEEFELFWHSPRSTCCKKCWRFHGVIFKVLKFIWENIIYFCVLESLGMTFLKNCTYAQPKYQSCWNFMKFSFTFRTITVSNLLQ